MTTTLSRITDTLRSAFAGKAGLLRLLLLAGVAIAMLAAVPNAAEACGITDPLSCVAMIFVKIFQLLTALMGWILVLEVEAVIRVSQYFNFVSPGPSAVRLGWIVTRDLANMFFIVILLIIAFGTILGSSTYSYEKNLPRLLIMAVVINFSKTICGLFIDMGQVIMLTFVNGFKEAAAGNFVNAFQINKLLALGNSPGSYNFGMVVAMMFAFILATICVCVTLVLLVVLLFRVVMLWVLIILSPIAFLSSAIPKGGDYYAQWWKEFKKYIITGPIIAFFLWLALASVQDVGPGGFASQGFPKTYAGQGEGAAAVGGISNTGGSSSTASSADDSKIVTEAGSADVIMNLVIAICILFAGLKFASESGAVGSGVAKSMRSGLEKTGRAVAMGGLRAVTSPVAGAAKSVGGRAMSVVGAGLAKTPFLGRTPLGALGRRMALKGEDMEESRRKEREKTYGSSAENLARFSPKALASKASLVGATDAQKLEKMKAAIGRPDALAAMKQSGAAKSLLAGAEALVKKDPSKRTDVDAFKKAAWSEIENPEEQKTVMGKMTGEEVRKYMKPEDFMVKDQDGKATDVPDVTNLARLSKGAMTDVLTNGKPDMKAAVMGSMNELERLGELDRTMKEKRMTYADIPAEAYDAAGAKADLLRSGAMAAAAKDSSLQKKFADDPLMRDALAPIATANLAKATEGPDRAKKRATAMMLGADAGPSTVDEEQEMATLSIKELSELDRNAPIDNKAIQEAIDKGITSALKHGTSDMAKAILSSPTMSQRVPLSEARAAETSTSGYTNNLARAADYKSADLDRQRKSSSPPPGVDAQIADLRKAMEAVGSAAKDLAAAEQTVLKHREDYGAAQKSSNTAAMKTVAASLKAAMNDTEKKKSALASANVDLKSRA